MVDIDRELDNDNGTYMYSIIALFCLTQRRTNIEKKNGNNDQTTYVHIGKWK